MSMKTLFRIGLAGSILAVSRLVLAGTIVVGTVSPLSGPDAGQGRAYQAGMQLYIDRVNKTGGVNGNTLVLAKRDDQGRAEQTVAATEELLADRNLMALAGYFGGSNLDALIASGLLQRGNIALVGYRTADIRQHHENLFSVRAGLGDEITKIVDHLTTVGISRLALLYEDTPAASELLSAVDRAALKARSSVVIKASYPAGTTLMSRAVDAFLAADPQAIIMVSSGAAAAAFVEAYRGSGGKAQLFAHSGADVGQLARRLSDEELQGLAIAQVTPNPYKSDTSVAREMASLVSAQKDLQVSIGYAMLEGFIAAKVIGEAIRMQGASVSRAGTKAAMERLKSFDVGGFVVNFGTTQHTGSRFVELSIVASGKIRQ